MSTVDKIQDQTIYNTSKYEKAADNFKRPGIPFLRVATARANSTLDFLEQQNEELTEGDTSLS